MAGENLASIFNALSQLFAPDIERQWNRTTYMLALIAAQAGVAAGDGRNVAFGVEFSGASAGTVAEGADIASNEFNSDINEPAFFPWCTYRSSFQATEQEVDIARRSAGSPTALMDLFGERIFGCQAQIARSIENDVLAGTGVDANGNPAIIGIFGGALSATGAYGGLNPATYSEWASNVVSNGGTLRALTPDLMAQVDQQIFTAASIPWDLIVTDAAITRKYVGIFTQGAPVTGATQQALVRNMDASPAPQYAIGPGLTSMSQLDNLYFMGRLVQRNPVSPANKIAFLNSSKMRMKYLPHVQSRNEIELFQMLGLQGSSGNIIQATGIPARVSEIAKTGDSHKVTMRATVAMAITRRNSCGLLTDVSEV